MSKKNIFTSYMMVAALSVALVFGSVIGATAVSEHEPIANPSDAGTSVQNGNADATSAGTDGDMTPGDLKLRYTKTSGDSTTASNDGTQFLTVIQDTIIETPADSMLIDIYVDADVTSKGGVVYGDQKVHSGADAADTSSSHPAFIERNDTAVFRLRIQNTGNGSETITFHIINWDTNPNSSGDPNLGFPQQGAEGAAGIVSRFEVSITDMSAASLASAVNGMSDSLTAPLGTVLTGVGSYPAQISLGTTALAEGAETGILLRVASLGTAVARDTIGLTVWAVADSHGAAYVAGSYARVSHDSGYSGDNDTRYAQGSSQDSVSVFVTVATAVVRLKKSDSIYAPASYATVTTGAGTSDVVPGATIVYSIVYDNDGNRIADTVEILDILPANVDLKVDSFINGVDTSYAHVRGLSNGTAWDTGVVVTFSNRSDSVNFNDTSNTTGQFTTAYNNKISDTVAGIKISFFDRGTGQAYPGSALAIDNSNTEDTTGEPNGPALDSNRTGGDSGDVGLIRFAVVIR